MKICQLSVFVENQPGELSGLCRLLAQADINILTLSLADSDQFGILRLIVKDWMRAKKALEEAGRVVKVTDVVAVEVPDHPGGLADVLAVIEEAGINIEYMYAFTFHRQDSAVICFRFHDPDAALRILQQKGVPVCRADDVCRLSAALGSGTGRQAGR